jgi:hypothetical protein
MKKLVLGVLGLAASMNVPASNWKPLPVASENAVYADVSSLTRDGSGLIHVWIKTDFMKPYPTQKGLRASYSVVRYVIDCHGRRMDTTSGKYYSVEGQLIEGYDEAGPLKEIVPDTIGDDIATITCKLANAT